MQVQLGAELNFRQLVTGAISDRVYSRIVGAKVQSVLEIGFGYNPALTYLYYAFGIPHLEGVESESEEKVMGYYWSALEDREKSPAAKSVYELASTVRITETDVRGKLESPAAFKTAIKLKFKNDFLSCTLDKAQYDMVILSNVLHYRSVEGCIAMLTRVQSILRPGGILYVRIKAGWPKNPKLSGIDLIRICDAAKEKFNLVKYIGVSDHEGQAVTYTNI